MTDSSSSELFAQSLPGPLKTSRIQEWNTLKRAALQDSAKPIKAAK